MSLAVAVFWLSVGGVIYPYFGYPLILAALASLRRRGVESTGAELPTVSMIIPVYNEASRIARKVTNTLALDYPADRLEVLVVSDGSTDDTVAQVRSLAPSIGVIELPARAGKAGALNAGLARAANEVLLFSDASIELEPASLRRLVRPFADPQVGCVSGEDRIAGSGGEAAYGRYELFLRQLESRVHSIVGASGSFYAQRRRLCQPFVEGLAPDFLSVLRTVEQGARALSESTAVGTMTAVKDPGEEFERKTRTVIRGLTTLFAYGHLLNPLRYGTFAFALWSHKVMRWLAPAFMVSALLSALVLAGSPWYLAALVAQVAFYALAAASARWAGVDRRLVGKLALYFTSVNVAILLAWWRYLRGVRQELWTPSQR